MKPRLPKEYETKTIVIMNINKIKNKARLRDHDLQYHQPGGDHICYAANDWRIKFIDENYYYLDCLIKKGAIINPYRYEEYDIDNPHTCVTYITNFKNLNDEVERETYIHLWGFDIYNRKLNIEQRKEVVEAMNEHKAHKRDQKINSILMFNPVNF
jgi:hypothetical protein